MPTKQQIKDEITIDPVGKGYGPFYSVRNDSSLLELINSLEHTTIVGEVYISARTLLGLGTTGVSILEKFKVLADGGNAQARWTIQFLNQESGINIGNAAAQATINALEQATVFTSDEANLLRSLAQVPISRSQQLWETQLSLQQLSEALNS